MRRALLVVSLFACKSDDRITVSSPAPAPVTEAVAPTPTPAPAITPTLELPAVVGLPVFLSKLTANAKEVDLSEPISRLEVDDTARSTDDAIAAKRDDKLRLYKTPTPGVFVQLEYAGGRFVGVTLLTGEPGILTKATNVWGTGEEYVDEFAKAMAGFNGGTPKGLKWISKTTGWTASLLTYVAPPPRELTEAERMIGWQAPIEPSYGILKIRVDNPAAASRPITAEKSSTEATTEAPGEIADAKVFPLLQSLLGTPLDKATQKLGGTVETADTVVAEASADKQGNAYLDVSWSETAWQVTLTPGDDGKVASVYVYGDIGDDERRVVLFKALSGAFGPAQPAITPAGRVEVGFPRMGRRLEFIDRESQIELTLTR